MTTAIELREHVERGYADYLAAVKALGGEEASGLPHCDDLVLHAPGKCEYCDHYPGRQALRNKMKIAFTGDGTYPMTSYWACPAEVVRPAETINRWGGNVAKTSEDLAREAEAWKRVEACLTGVCAGCGCGASEDDPCDCQGAATTIRGSAVKPVAEHAFNRAVDATIARAQAVGNQRGGEYSDTWALENQRSTFLCHVLRMKGIDTSDRAWLRLLLVASLIDVKDSRMLGPWKQDSVDDGINYRAAFADWRESYEKESGR